MAGKKVNRQLNKMTSSYEDLKKMGVEFETKILSLKPFKATETLSQEFQMDEKEPLWEIRRLRSSEGKPVLIQLLYLRQKFCPALDKIEHLERESIYHLLEQNYHLKLDHAQQDINAMLSDKKQMKLLGLEDATAMLHIHRKGFLSDESVFEVTDLYFVGNFFKYSLILYR